MPYGNPGWSNGEPPALNKPNLDDMSNTLEDLDANAVKVTPQTFSTSEQDTAKANIAALSYNAQTLSTAQQQQARTNIAALSYNSQTLSNSQKTQARSNIGAQATPVYNAAQSSLGALTVSDNNIYILTNVTSCTLSYPVGNFICTIRFTTAESGAVTSALVFPDGTKFMGVVPAYANNASYECSIMSAGGLPVAIISAIGEGV